MPFKNYRGTSSEKSRVRDNKIEEVRKWRTSSWSWQSYYSGQWDHLHRSAQGHPGRRRITSVCDRTHLFVMSATCPMRNMCVWDCHSHCLWHSIILVVIDGSIHTKLLHSVCFHSCASQHKRVFVEILFAISHPGFSLRLSLLSFILVTRCQHRSMAHSPPHPSSSCSALDTVFPRTWPMTTSTRRTPVYCLAATDASFDKSRQIREAAMRAHAEVSISDRIEDLFRARPWTQTVL